MRADALTWLLGTQCVSYLRALAFMRRQGPGRFPPESHARAMRRMENTAAALATIAGHYGRRALRQAETAEYLRTGQWP